MAEPILREILLAFWKVHILHHAQERPIYGQWLLDELRRHGFQVSPGTLYPLLARMEKAQWLKVLRNGSAPANHSPKARREYVLTGKGAAALMRLRDQVAELHHEVVEEAARPLRRSRTRI